MDGTPHYHRRGPSHSVCLLLSQPWLNCCATGRLRCSESVNRTTPQEYADNNTDTQTNERDVQPRHRFRNGWIVTEPERHLAVAPRLLSVAPGSWPPSPGVHQEWQPLRVASVVYGSLGVRTLVSSLAPLSNPFGSPDGRSMCIVRGAYNPHQCDRRACHHCGEFIGLPDQCGSYSTQGSRDWDHKAMLGASDPRATSNEQFYDFNQICLIITRSVRCLWKANCDRDRARGGFDEFF